MIKYFLHRRRIKMSRITNVANYRSCKTIFTQCVYAASCNTRARVYPRPIALCNEIRIRSPASSYFTRRVSHALFLLTVHVDVTTIQYRNTSHTIAKCCSSGNRLCVCDYIVVEDKRSYRARVR